MSRYARKVDRLPLLVGACLNFAGGASLLYVGALEKALVFVVAANVLIWVLLAVHRDGREGE